MTDNSRATGAVRGIEIGFDAEAGLYTVSAVEEDGGRTSTAPRVLLGCVATKAEAVEWQARAMEQHGCQGWSTADVSREALRVEAEAGCPAARELLEEANFTEDTDEFQPCSLCGGSTHIETSDPSAAWYLCRQCEGTDAARAAGYVHG